MNVAVIGVGKLGEVAAKVFSDAGHRVFGYDKYRDYADIKNDNFTMCGTFANAVLDAKYVFIAAATPHPQVFEGAEVSSHLEPEDFDYTSLDEIMEDVTDHCTKDQIVVLISTVSPTTIRHRFREVEQTILYNPYLIAQGTIEHDMKNAEMLIIGSDEARSKEALELEEFYSEIVENKDMFIAHGTWEECESIKMFYNTFLSMKLTFANLVSHVSDYTGANPDVITQALGNCKGRIMSSKQFKSGMPVGGVCLPRDNIALSALTRKAGLNYNMFDAITQTREKQAEYIALKALSKKTDKIVIVGRSYKPGVPIDNGSPSLLIKQIIGDRCEVEFHDPLMGDFLKRDANLTYTFIFAHYDFENNCPFTYEVPAGPGDQYINPWG